MSVISMAAAGLPQPSLLLLLLFFQPRQVILSSTTELIMAMTKAGKQLYKLNTQFNLNIFCRNYVNFYKSAIENVR